MPIARGVARTANRLLVVVLLLWCLTVVPAGPAQGGLWEPIGPEGGPITSIVVGDPFSSRIWVSSAGSGPFVSTSGGTSWTYRGGAFEPFLGGGSDVRIALSGATTYAATRVGGCGGVFVSNDDGISWAPINEGLPFPCVEHLATLAGTPFTATPWADGLYSWNGTAWELVQGGLPQAAVAMVATAGVEILGAELWTSFWNGGLYRSSNGTSWVPEANGLPAGGTVRSLTSSNFTVGQLTLYAHVDGYGVYTATEPNVTWTPISQGLTGFVAQVAASVFGGAVFAASSDGVFRTTNGTTWQRVGEDVVGAARSVAVEPLSGTVYAGTDDGVFRSTDGGDTWTPANAGLYGLAIADVAVGSGGEVYAATSQGVYRRSQAPDASFERIGPSAAIRVFTHPALPGTVMAAFDAASQLMRTTNDGGLWTPIDSGLGSVGFSKGVRALAVNGNAPSTMYATTSGGVYKTTNGGSSWSAIVNGLPSSAGWGSLVMSPTNPSVLWVGGDSGVYSTAAGGVLWSTASSGLVNGVRALAIDPSDAGRLYAQTFSQVARSLNGGGSWSGVADTTFTFNNASALAVDASDPSRVYAGTWSGVLRSVDRGATWAPHDPGLATRRVQTLESGAAGTIYAGTNAGVYRLVRVCGDGELDTGEECDAGVVNGNPTVCCDVECQLRAPGTSCGDGMACTADGSCTVTTTTSSSSTSTTSSSSTSTTSSSSTSTTSSSSSSTTSSSSTSTTSSSSTSIGTSTSSSSSTSTSTSSSTSTTAGIGTSTSSTTTPTTSSTSTTAPAAEPEPRCGNGVVEADNDEECDDGDVLSETDCCNQNCRFRAVQTLCGGVPVGPCDEQDRCDGRGHCVPRVREPQSRECRPLATIDDCDLGDFCDGSSADCPTTGDGAGCDATTPETVRGTVIPVSCTTILGVAKGTVSECSASGAEAVASQSITGAGATVPTLTNVARGNLKKGKKGTTERHRVLRLKLNKLGKALLKERGVLNVQVDVQITHGRAKGKTVQRLVTMLRKAS